MKGDKVKQRLEEILANPTAEQLPRAELFLRLLELYAPAKAGQRTAYEQQRDALLGESQAYKTAEQLLRELEYDKKLRTDIMKRAKRITFSDMKPEQKHEEYRRLQDECEQEQNYEREEYPTLMQQLRTATEELINTPHAIFLSTYDRRIIRLEKFYEPKTDQKTIPDTPSSHQT